MKVYVISEAIPNGKVIAVTHTKKGALRVIRQLCTERHDTKVAIGLAHLPGIRYNYIQKTVRA